MKKFVLLLFGLFLLVSVDGQIGRFPFHLAPVVEEEEEGYTDDFESYSEGTLAGQGTWVSCCGSMTINDVSGNNVVHGGSSDCAVRRTETYTDDQYAEITLKGIGASGGIGVGVRLQVDHETYGDGGYVYFATPTTRWLAIYTGGGWNSGIAYTSPTTNYVNDVLRLEVEGTTIRCYYNGSLDTALTGGTGIFTDSTWTGGGSPGVSGDGTSDAHYADDWEGGDL